MAEWQLRFRNKDFAGQNGVYGSHDYTVALEDMADWPFSPELLDSSVQLVTDGGKLFVYNKYSKVAIGLQFNDVSQACLATLGSLYTDRIDFLFFEDVNNALSYHFLPAGTGTCHLVEQGIKVAQTLPGLYSFGFNFMEVNGRMNVT